MLGLSLGGNETSAGSKSVDGCGEEQRVAKANKLIATFFFSNSQILIRSS
jgi:hypothetical protein